MTEEAAELKSVKVDNSEGQCDRLFDLVTQAIDAYCTHPETPEFNFGQIISALTACIAFYAIEGGCDNESKLKVSIENFGHNIAQSARAIWETEKLEAEEAAAELLERKRGMN